MSRPRSDLVVLVARRSEANAFLGVLQDWSALGLISDFAFVDVDVDVDELGAAGGSFCVSVSQGVGVAGRLSAILARRTHTTAARVVCLSQVADTFSTVGLGRGAAIRREVRDSLPGADLTWIHAIAIAVPSIWPSIREEDLAWVGAHNVVLAPENSQSPIAGVEQLTASQRLRPEGLTLQSAALCSAVGLWANEPRSFFVGEPAAGGGQVVALRAFSRHIALEGIRSEVLGRLVDVSVAYPIPAIEDGRAQVVGDEAAANREMVDSLFGLHAELRPGVRSTTSVPARKALPFFEAIRLFLTFFAGALRGAPQDLFKTLERAASARLASAGQNALFGGSDSGYVVTVNGVHGIKPDGTVATPKEFDKDILNLLAQVQGMSGATPPERQEWPELWRDFVDGGLTLLDGSQRNKDLEPRRIGVGIAVVNKPLSIAADPEDRFPVPEVLQAAIGARDISPYDDELARMTCLVLEQRMRDRPDQASGLAVARDDLKSWFDVRARSYVGGVGRRLTTNLNGVREEAVRYAAELAGTANQSSDSDQHLDAQTSLARVLVGYAAFCVLLLGLVELLAVLGAVSWKVGLSAVPVILLLWLIPSTVVFLKRQQNVFEFLHRRQQTDSELAARKANLADALVDLRRLQSIYRQYLSWSQGLGTFVRAPLGRVQATADVDAVLGEGFCLNHRFGVVVPVDGALDEVSRQLQAELFPVGWLSDAWARYLEDLPAFRDRHLVEAKPELLFTDKPVSDVSVLAQWSDAVVISDRVDAAGNIKDRVAELFEAGADRTIDRLLSTVRARRPQGGQNELAYSDFVLGLQDIVEGRAGNRQFSQAIFAPVPETADPWRVADVMVCGGRGDVRPLIITELTRAFGPRDLIFGQPSKFEGPALPIRPASTPPQV